MIPQLVNDGLTLDFEEVVEPSKTFKLDINRNRIVGFVDGAEAMAQAIFIMTSIERYEYIIFSWNVGIETKDLYGKPTAYVASEIKRRITDCLMQDERITSVDSFDIQTEKRKVIVRYTAHTIFGEVVAEKEVDY